MLALLQKHSFPRLTVPRVHRLLSAGILSSEDVCAYCYAVAVAGEEEWKLHAFERLASKDIIVEHARQADARRRRAASLSVLDGIPVSIKANLAVASLPLTAGSRILGTASKSVSSVAAAGYDAAVTESLLTHCGAVLIGSTSLDEFGMGSLGMNVVGGATRNPLPLMKQRNSSCWDDELLVELIRLPSDAIHELHSAALAAVVSDGPYYSAGGSSCGGAVSVAHGSSMISLGSDTGGSIRLPASWCGIAGLKPTYGLLSRHGLVSYASSLDTVGILAPTVECAATTLNCILFAQQQNQSTIRDSTQIISTEAYLSTIQELTSDLGTASPTAKGEPQQLLSGIKVGIPAAFSVSECPISVTDAWCQGAEWLERHGAVLEHVSVDRISPDILQKSLAAYYVLVSAEASSNLSRYDGLRYGEAVDPASIDWNGASQFSILEKQYAITRTRGFGPEVIRRVLCGTSVLSSNRFHTHYESAAKLRAILTNQLHQTLFSKSNSDDCDGACDLLLIPTTVFPPHKTDAVIDQTEMLANDVMTVPISLSGLPAISVPVGAWHADHNPFQVGLQLVAARHGEADLLRTAVVLEKASCGSMRETT